MYPNIDHWKAARCDLIVEGTGRKTKFFCFVYQSEALEEGIDDIFKYQQSENLVRNTTP